MHPRFGSLVVALALAGTLPLTARGAVAPTTVLGTMVTYVTGSGEQQTLWRVEGRQGAVPENLSAQFDLLTRFPGVHQGPVSVSGNGKWYAFYSERFDEKAQNWAALTLARTDLSKVEAVRVNDEPVHGEGPPALLRDGSGVVLNMTGGPHTRDIYLVARTDTGWAEPRLLTGDSSFDWNYGPTVSPDGTRVLFNMGPTDYPSVAVGEVHVDGTGFRTVIGKNDGPFGSTPATIVETPTYTRDGDIMLRADWNPPGYAIWKLLPKGGFATLTDTAGSSGPAGLPDGNFASYVYEGEGYRVQLRDGTGRLLTSLSPAGVPVAYMALGAGPLRPEARRKGILSVSPVSLSFGKVRRGRVVSRTLSIRNTGSGRLAGRIVATKLPFEVTKGGEPFSLPPKGKREVTVAFRPEVGASFRGVLRIETNAPNRPAASVKLSGKGL